MAGVRGGRRRELLGRTRFPVPEPVAIGEPGAGYPLPWSVHTWLPGRTATEVDPGNSTAFAQDLAEFVAAVRAIDPRGRMFADILGSDELEWRRGMAWAFEQAMGAAWYYLDTNPPMSRMARRTLTHLLAPCPLH